MYGTQAIQSLSTATAVFENDVKMYGTQAFLLPCPSPSVFENDVKMYGTQAQPVFSQAEKCLRMM